MALVKCSECGTEISDKAAVCVKCGAKPKKKTSLFTWIVGAVFIVIVFIMVVSPDEQGRNTTTTPATTSTTAIAPVQMACNREAAQKVQDGVNGLAQVSNERGYLKVKWGTSFFSWGKDQQLLMAQNAANADECLSGSAREIRFYSPAGKFNAVATPTTGIRLVD
jgi:hypothetical protein